MLIDKTNLSQTVISATEEQAERMHRLLKAFLCRYHKHERDKIIRCGFSVWQYYVLDCIAERGEAIMSTLANDLLLDNGFLTHIVSELVKRKFVIRCYSDSDRRETLVSLTDHGRQVWQEIYFSLLESRRLILDRIEPGKREQTFEILELLRKSL